MVTDSPDSCPSPTVLLWPLKTEEVIQAVEGGLSGKKRHIAIISEIFAGREELLSAVECSFQGKVRRIILDSFPPDDSLFSPDPDAGIIIMENCQFLFQRTINGFTILDSFIRRLSTDDRIWVTTWNVHSWNYISAVRGISPLFPVRIHLGQKSHDELKEFILSSYEGSIFYLIDVPVPKRMIMLHRQKKIHIPLTSISVTIPYFSVNLTLLSAMIRGKSQEAEADNLIFERLSQVSNGNPGIARQIWERSLGGWEIRMSALTQPKIQGIGDPDTAYLLALLLSYEKIHIRDIRSVVPEDIVPEKILSELEDAGFIDEKDGWYSVKLTAISDITREMKRVRMVW